MKTFFNITISFLIGAIFGMFVFNWSGMMEKNVHLIMKENIGIVCEPFFLEGVKQTNAIWEKDMNGLVESLNLEMERLSKMMMKLKRTMSLTLGVSEE